MRVNVSKRTVRVIHLCVLVASVLISYRAAFEIRFQFHPPPRNLQAFFDSYYWIAVASALWFSVHRTYTRIHRWSLQDIWSMMAAVGLIGVSTMAISFGSRAFAFPRTVILLGAVINAALVLLVNWFFGRLERWLYGPTRVAVIGNGDAVERIDEVLQQLKKGIYEVHYVLPSAFDPRLQEAIKAIDAVFLVGVTDPRERETIFALCVEHECQIVVFPDVTDIVLHGAELARVGDVPFFYVRPLGLAVEERLYKRLIDIVASVVLLVVTLPLTLLAAVAVKLTSPGPVLYKQVRVGRHGRHFTMVKIRTMIHNAERESGPVVATENDPRITPVGRILRKLRIDELPQLWNVLRGEMSIVGPRPERPKFVEQYGKEIPHYRYRLLVKPGLTGLAQVFGRYGTDPREKLKYDLYYIRNYSVMLDLQIMLRTVRVMLTPSAAEGVRGQVAPGRQIVDPTVASSRE